MPDSDKPTLPATNDALSRRLLDVDGKIADLMVLRRQILEEADHQPSSCTEHRADEGAYDLHLHGCGPLLEKLLQRVKETPLHTPSFIRVFCEIFAATSPRQDTTSVAVFMPSRGAGYLELCRDFYGAYVQTTPVHTTGSVVRLVATGEATLGIVPLPKQDDPHRWWPLLLSTQPNTPRIVARLPFTGPGQGRGDGLEALVLYRHPLSPFGTASMYHSNPGRALISIETLEGISRASLGELFTKVGLRVLEMPDAIVPATGARLHLVEIEDNLTQDDPRLHTLKSRSPITSLTVLGRYAPPLEESSL